MSETSDCGDWSWPSIWSSTPATCAGLTPGARFGDFEVLGTLGRGGMGQVFRVRSPGTGRELALKLSLDRSSPRALGRFRNEGVVTAALRHPGIIGIHAAGEADGVPYLVYELVEEAQELDEAWEALDLRGRARLIAAAARAVGHAHAQGVIHRDLKPANVLVDAEGRVRVADFGLASMVGLERLTRTGQLIGTPLYMAPEQIINPDPAPQLDVWSLGVMLYQALTGRMPVEADSVAELVGLLVSARIQPPHSVAPAVPPALSGVCMRALARALEDRYPDAGALADDLDRWLAGEAPLAAPPPLAVRLARRWGLAGGVVTLVGLLGGATLALGPEPSAARASPRDAGEAPSPRRGEPAGEPPSAASLEETPSLEAEALPWERRKGVSLSELLPPPGEDAPQHLRDYYRQTLSGEASHTAQAQLAEAYVTGHQGMPRAPAAGVALLESLVEEDLSLRIKLAEVITDAFAATDPRAAEAAVAHLALAGEEGDRRAWVRLGEVFERGQTALGSDPARARAYYRRGVEVRDIPAIAALGRCLLRGVGGPRDLAEGERLLQRACDAGHKYAAYELGRALIEGDGLARDVERGRSLLRQAAARGVAGAAEMLERQGSD